MKCHINNLPYLFNSKVRSVSPHLRLTREEKAPCLRLEYKVAGGRQMLRTWPWLGARVTAAVCPPTSPPTPWSQAHIPFHVFLSFPPAHSSPLKSLFPPLPLSLPIYHLSLLWYGQAQPPEQGEAGEKQGRGDVGGRQAQGRGRTGDIYPPPLDLTAPLPLLSPLKWWWGQI